MVLGDNWAFRGQTGRCRHSVRRLSLVSHVGSTGQALLRASRHGDRFILPIDLSVVLAQPCVPKYCGMPTEFRNRKDRSFGVVIVSKDGLYDLTNHTGLVRCTVDVKNRDHLVEGPCRDFVLSNVVLVDEETSGATIDKHGGATLDTQVG